MKNKICFQHILLLSLCLLVIGSAHAQKITYADVAVTNNAVGARYIVGKQDNNIVIWLYNAMEQSIQLEILNNDMHLQNKASIKMAKTGFVRSINFLQKHNCYDILVQYISKNELINQVFTFNKDNRTIIPSTMLEKSNAATEMKLKISNNGSYIGFVSGYKTVNDSALIQYTVYNNQYELVKNTRFLLPQKENFIDLDASMIDNAGNLYFYSTHEADTGIYAQDITIYKVDWNKNSLLTNDIVRNGQFANVAIEQNYSNNNLCIKGLWKNNDLQDKFNQKEYLFIIELNENLSTSAAMTVVPASKIADSVFATNALLRSANFIANKDAGYTLYVSGLTNSKDEPVNTYTPSGYIQRAAQHPNIPAVQSFYEGRATPADLTNPVAPNIPNVYAPAGNNISNYQPPATAGNNDYPNNHYTSPQANTLTSGNNFFMMLQFSKEGSLAVHNFKDSTAGIALPGFEFIANTGQQIHYLYSRTEKKNKQLIFDISFEKDGQMHTYPVVTDTKHNLLLNNGIQVSSNTVVFPFYNYNYGILSFAKMDIE